MANMSYCRFHNTYYALRDCVNTVDEAVCDGLTREQFLNSLSNDEKYAFNRLLTYCQDFIDNVDQLEEAQALEDVVGTRRLTA